MCFQPKLMDLRKIVRYITLVVLLHCFLYNQSKAQSSPATTTVWVDSCISSTFRGMIDINSQYSFSRFRNVHKYIGGDIVVVGEIRPNLAGVSAYHVYGLVMRLSHSGQIKWAKFVGSNTPTLSNDYRFYASVVASNNDIVLVSHIDILRLDPTGNIVWQRNLPRNSTSEIVEQIIETTDHGFLLCGPSFYNGRVTKLNSIGNVVWNKGYSLDSYLNCRSVVETPSGYFFTGYSYDSFADLKRSVLVKLNKQNGDTLWSRCFTQPKGEYAYDWMVYKDGNLHLTGNTSVNFNDRRAAQSLLTLSEDGAFVSAKRIENPDIAVEKSSLFRSRLFDVSSRTGVQYNYETDEELYVYRLDSMYQKSWAFKYPVNPKEFILDMAVFEDSSVAVAGASRLSGPEFRERALLISLSSGGNLANCNSVGFQPLVTNEIIPVSPVKVNVGPLSTDVGTPFNIPVFEPSGFQWQIECNSQSSCYLGKIEGPKNVCTGSVITYAAKRKGLCDPNISFSTSNSLAQVQVINDSTVNLYFQGSGTVTLYAQMGSNCGQLKDSLTIHISSSPGAVNLGANRQICPGNTIVLSAGNSYSSYLWQDGSTDSLFTVQQPGRYSVQVKDVCGNVFTDTVEIEPHPPFTFDAGPDRIKCNNDTLQLTAPSGFLNYEWLTTYLVTNPQSQSIIVNPLIDTFYVVRAEKTPGCIAYDTIHITTLHSPQIQLGQDQRFCPGDSATFDAGNGFSQYTWSNGSTGSAITVTAPGFYDVAAVFFNQCISRDTVRVLPPYTQPTINIHSDTSLCAGGNRIISPGANFASYRWHDGSISPSFNINTTGTYWVQVTDINGCKASDTVNVTKVLPSPSGFLPKDTVICSYSDLELTASGNFRSYLWSNSATSKKIISVQPGDYWLKVTDWNNCQGTDSIHITTKECPVAVYVPSAFTPNNDGLNDLFNPVIFGRQESFEFRIYDRWGKQIFFSQEPSKGWNGTFKGKESVPGVYVWMLKYKLAGSSLRFQKGTVILIK